MEAQRSSYSTFCAQLKHLHAYACYLLEFKKQLLMGIMCGILCGLSSGFGVPFILKLASRYIFAVSDVSSVYVVLFCISPIMMMGIRGISGFFSAYYMGYCGQKLLERIRIQVFEKMQRLPLEFFHKTPPGEIISRAMNDAALLQGAIIDIAENIIQQPVTFLGSILVLIYLCIQQSNILVLLLYAVAFPFILLPIKKVGHRLREKTGNVQGKTGELTDRLSRNLAAIQEVRAFCMEEREIASFAKACQMFSKAALTALKYNILLSPSIEIIASIGIGFAMYFSYKRGITIDTFIALTGAFYFSYDPIKKLGWLNGRIQTAFSGLKRIQLLIEVPEPLQNPQNPIPLGKIRGEIIFRGVNFAYDPAKPTLQDIDLRLEAGKLYALVGRNGSGKTTLVQLLMRFYELQSGSIFIDGIDISKVHVRELRQQMALVPQNSMLLNGSVEDNIRWGKWDATKEEVIAASQSANAHDFILHLKEGYQTNIGECGSLLSGGQRQCIALARAFLRQAPILILDEATSALDVHNEYSVHQAIRHLVQNKTVLMISHHFNMMSMVDEVIVLQSGRVVEQGSVRELMESPLGAYRELFVQQQGGQSHE